MFMASAQPQDALNPARNPADQPHRAPNAAQPSVAYLVSRYPTLSMIFVLREVLALRALGFRIETASINPPDRPAAQLTQHERDEAARTYCIKAHSIPGAASAHARSLLTAPRGYFRGLALAFRLARLDLARLLLNLAYFTEGLMIGQWMARNRQTHLHVHLASQAASVGLFTHTVFATGYSLSVHGPDEFADVEGKYLARKIAAARFIVCISAFTQSQLMNIAPYEHWHKFSVVRLGVDPGFFDPGLFDPALIAPSESRTDKDSPSTSSSPIEVLCVGRLTPAKGQHLLIDAIGRLSASGRRVRLRLVGGGPDEASLRQCAAQLPDPEVVIFEGPVNQDRIRDFYAQADIFCLPSFAEGLPVVLMEAMASGVPCVSTSIAGIPELIRSGMDGLLVPASDLDALVEALSSLIDNPALRQRLAQRARTRVVQHYDLARNVQALAEVFRTRLP
jgi:colanic acid/amylovoran biosynthesis glycosyltransferase